MKHQSSPAVFLHTFWLVVIIVFITVCAFNVLVDPFGMFGTKRIPGFNELKPEIGPRDRMAKAYRIRVVQPHGIILGSSRAEIGLDPEHPGWDKKSYPVYSLALSNARVDEILGYLIHAQLHGPLEEVVLAIDFFMFNANWRHEASFDASRLSVPGSLLHDTGWIEDLVKALFSLDGVKASIDTIRVQNIPTTPSYYPNGARDTRRKWAEIRAKGGHRQAFLSNTLYELTHADGWPLFSLDDNAGVPTPFETFKEIVKFCQQQKINLHILISPIHVLKQEVIWQLGLGFEYERWKRSLVGILNNSGTPLWDFSGYNSITMEPFPPLGDVETQMKHYWEGSHYRKRVGDLILDRLFDFQEFGRTVPDGFGIRLDASNIDAHLLATRNAREHYIHTHQRDVEEIAKQVQETEIRRRAIKALNMPGQEGR